MYGVTVVDPDQIHSACIFQTAASRELHGGYGNIVRKSSTDLLMTLPPVKHTFTHSDAVDDYSVHFFALLCGPDGTVTLPDGVEYDKVSKKKFLRQLKAGAVHMCERGVQITEAQKNPHL